MPRKQPNVPRKMPRKQPKVPRKRKRTYLSKRKNQYKIYRMHDQGGSGHNQQEVQEKRKPHIKKPLNAFMLFRRDQRAGVVAECKLKESAIINQIVGRKWHALDRSEQSKYYEMALKEKELHLQLYPGWSARDNYASHKKRKKKDPHAPTQGSKDEVRLSSRPAKPAPVVGERSTRMNGHVLVTNTGDVKVGKASKRDKDGKLICMREKEIPKRKNKRKMEEESDEMLFEEVEKIKRKINYRNKKGKKFNKKSEDNMSSKPTPEAEKILTSKAAPEIVESVSKNAKSVSSKVTPEIGGSVSSKTASRKAENVSSKVTPEIGGSVSSKTASRKAENVSSKVTPEIGGSVSSKTASRKAENVSSKVTPEIGGSVSSKAASKKAKYVSSKAASKKEKNVSSKAASKKEKNVSSKVTPEIGGSVSSKAATKKGNNVLSKATPEKRQKLSETTTIAGRKTKLRKCKIMKAKMRKAVPT